MKEKNCINKNIKSSENALNAYSLAGIGIGGIIGSGFFLGSSLAINEAGPSVILSFLFGGLIMSQVLGAMTSISINRLGTKHFGFIESIMSVIKVVILIIFIILGILVLIKTGIVIKQNPFTSFSSFFPNKISGFLQSMLIIVFTYGGISTVAMATSELRRPCLEIPKATILMTLGIVSLYVLSMLIIICTVDWNIINTDISPFVQSFNNIGYGWASTLINGAILISTFSVMIVTYYGCVQMLTSLAEAQKAPALLKISNEKGIYKYSWLTTGGISILVVLIAFILGSKLFNYLISSSSYFSFFNWITNLITYTVWLKKRDKNDIYDSPLIKGKLSAIITIIVIFILLIMSLSVSDFRIGFYVALSISLIISLSYKFTTQE